MSRNESLRKRFVLVLLAFALAFSVPAATAFADEPLFDGADQEIEETILEEESEVSTTAEPQDRQVPEADAKHDLNSEDYGEVYPVGDDAVVEYHDMTESVADVGHDLSAMSTDITPQATSESWKAKKGQTITVTNLYGATRLETNTDIVKASYSKADTVILASAENFPDALSGSTLSGVLDAPIVLVNKASLSAESASTIKSLGAKKIIVLGSSAAISDKTYDAAKKLVSDTSSSIRLGGKDRYETNAKIYQYLVKLGYQASSEVILATGQNFADALSISSYAAWAKIPVILTSPSGLNATMKSELKSYKGRVTVCGSEAAVSAANANWFKGNGATIARYGGSHRYATSKLIAEYVVSKGMDSSAVVIATGQNFPDALSGAQLGNKRVAPIMLVNGQTEGLSSDEAIREYLGKYDAKVTDIIYLGSNAAVKDSKRTEIKDFLAEVPTYTVTWNGFDVVNPKTGVITYGAAIKQTYKRGQIIKAPNFAFTFTSTMHGAFYQACFNVPQRQDGSYCFNGWDKNYDKATANMTITATWKKVVAVEWNSIPGGNTWPTGAAVAAWCNSDSTISWNPKNWFIGHQAACENIGGYTAASLGQDTSGADWNTAVWREMRADSSAVGGYRINYYVLTSGK